MRRTNNEPFFKSLKLIGRNIRSFKAIKHKSRRSQLPLAIRVEKEFLKEFWEDWYHKRLIDKPALRSDKNNRLK